MLIRPPPPELYNSCLKTDKFENSGRIFAGNIIENINDSEINLGSENIIGEQDPIINQDKIE